MSLPDSASPSATVQKPKLNVYTMMLVISLIALCIACGLLYAEYKRFQSGSEQPWNTSEAKPNLTFLYQPAPGMDQHYPIVA